MAESEEIPKMLRRSPYTSNKYYAIGVSCANCRSVSTISIDMGKLVVDEIKGRKCPYCDCATLNTCLI